MEEEQLDRLHRDVFYRNRDHRQLLVSNWAKECFGQDEAISLPQRGLRLLEESIETAQSTGVPLEVAHKLIDYVYGRPVGELSQELGGVAVTSLALAEAAGFSADHAECVEVFRVLSKPRTHFTDRNKVKNDAGFVAVGEQFPDGYKTE